MTTVERSVPVWPFMCSHRNNARVQLATVPMDDRWRWVDLCFTYLSMSATVRAAIRALVAHLPSQDKKRRVSLRRSKIVSSLSPRALAIQSAYSSQSLRLNSSAHEIRLGAGGHFSRTKRRNTQMG